MRFRILTVMILVAAMVSAVFSKVIYSNFSLTLDYSSCEPSLRAKVSQPLLYNILRNIIFNRLSISLSGVILTA